MTFAPKKKISKSRTNRRTTNWIRMTAQKILGKTSLQYDAEGNAIALSHFASPITGQYKGRQVISVSSSQGKVKKIRA